MAELILIADDKPNNLKLIRDLLRVAGYKTIAATDGEQAVRLARERKPDLIIMDIMMPKLDRLKATRILKADATTRNIPVIALTSLAMKGDDKKILRAGCDGYLTKPIDIQEFLAKVAEYLPR